MLLLFLLLLLSQRGFMLLHLHLRLLLCGWGCWQLHQLCIELGYAVKWLLGPSMLHGDSSSGSAGQGGGECWMLDGGGDAWLSHQLLCVFHAQSITGKLVSLLFLLAGYQ